MAQISWEDACERVQADDDLPVREAGSWSEDKLFVWHKYIQMTTTAMVGNPHFPGGLFYVDLFAGPGVCRLRESGKRVPGSPLIAAMAPKPFQNVFIVEAVPALAAAAKARMKSFGLTATVFEERCQTAVKKIVPQLPARSLTLAFIDPEALDADFETVSTLASAGRVDLLVLFADAYDAVRNLDRMIDGEDDRLDKMFGPNSGWRDAVKALPNLHGNTLRECLSTQYMAQLKTKLGYKQTDVKIISGPRGPMYRLVYASKSDRGLDFWRKVDYRDRGGQSGLFGV